MGNTWVDDTDDDEEDDNAESDDEVDVSGNDYNNADGDPDLGEEGDDSEFHSAEEEEEGGE
jgi:hypothetical protein